MAEARRIPLETVEVVPKEKKDSESAKTHRFSLALLESNEKSCPEFSYTDLVSKTCTNEKKDSHNDDDPYGEGEEDEKKLRDMARKFEEKYGPKVVNTKDKNKKSARWEDYIDRGLGYDETDPFIDNNEAYDELVPSTLTTQFGGFYINSGELEFRNVSDSDSDGIKPRRKRRRILDKVVKRRFISKDASEVKDETPRVPKKRGRKPIDRSIVVPPSGSADDSALNKLKRKATPTVAALLQERKAKLQQLTQPSVRPSADPGAMAAIAAAELLHPPTPADEMNDDDVVVVARSERGGGVKRLSSSSSSSSDGDSPAAPVPVVSSSESEFSLDNLLDEEDCNIVMGAKGSTLNSNINDIIESVVQNAEDILNAGTLFISDDSEDGEDDKGVGAEEEKGGDEEKGGMEKSPMDEQSTDAPKLPDNLPSDLTDLVFRIKQAALVTAEGKCKFFSGEVNRMLLSIEVKSRELSCTQRSMIYSHLASYLPCTKETLLKRAKKLRLDQEGGKLASPMHRLRDAVNQVLPIMKEKYEIARINAKKGMQNETAHGEDGSTENKTCDIPKKKFEWNERLRGLLCEVVRIKLKCYEVLKMRTQSAEEFLHQFLEMEVLLLWPSDWMTTRILLKESRSAHAYITSNKSKKPWVIVKKVAPSSPSTAAAVASVLPVSSSSIPNAQNFSKPSLSQEMVAANSIMALATAGGSSSPGAYVEEIDDDSNDNSGSSSKLFIASPDQSVEAIEVIRIEKETLNHNKTNTSSESMKHEGPKHKADVYAEPMQNAALKQTSAAISNSGSNNPLLASPSKRIFTLMNSEETAQLNAQHSAPQASFAAQMLDRIICASLANFPNSGTSLAMPEIGGKPIKAEIIQKETIETITSAASAALITNPRTVKSELTPEIIGDYQNSSNNKSVTNPVLSPTQITTPGAISILKSNYGAPGIPNTPLVASNPLSSSRTNHRSTVLDHGSNISTSKSSSSKSNLTNSTSKSNLTNSSVLKSGVSPALPTMPAYQAFEFQEAFKRSLGLSVDPVRPIDATTPSSVRSNSSSMEPRSRVGVPRQSVSRKITNESLLDEPMNFSTSNNNAAAVASIVHSTTTPISGGHSAYTTAAQELNRLASVVQPTPNSRISSSSSRHRTSPRSPDQAFAQGIVFPEGMKGFPMPLKTNANSSSSANQQPSLHPPPAHSYPPSRRMSPNDSSVFTSSNRPNSQSPLQPSSVVQSSSGLHTPISATSNSVSASHGVNHSLPYPTGSPSLSHYSTAEVTHALSMGNWSSTSGRPLSPVFSTPSQYSNSSVVVQATSPSSYTVPGASHLQTSTVSGYPLTTSPQHQRGGISVVHKSSSNIPSPAHQSGSQKKTVTQNIAYNSLYGGGQYPNSQRSNQQPSHQRIP